jgi:CRISPR-associated protein Cmr6
MYMYSGPKLIEALAKQHEQRSKSELFKSGTFTLGWRAKVGSFPHADTETIVSAGEPCGTWSEVTVTRRERNQNGQWQNNEYQSRPEDKRDVGENWQAMEELPLYGYIPAASIRGIVRAWASQYPALEPRMKELLGYQTESEIIAGKIEFLDAFPTEPTKLSLDIVNPQQNFQVFHQGQSTPLSLYTLGDGHNTRIDITVAIRGKAGATADEVNTVWEWVQQALSTQGIGSRNASGYGALKAPSGYRPSDELPRLPEGYNSKVLSFTLYSQGNAGPHMGTIELRPTHWRGWLRSWLLRFFLGVMSPNDARFTVGELLGTLEESTDGESRQGKIRLQLIPNHNCWTNESEDHRFRKIYKWQGQIKISAPTEILNQIILPIIKIANRVGGVGKGWRRPLHRFVMNNNNQDEAARGCHLELTFKDTLKATGEKVNRSFSVNLTHEKWTKLYDTWKASVKNYWGHRYSENITPINAEVFSPRTCAVYLVNGPARNPIDSQHLKWRHNNPTDTRGKGMSLIYNHKYKRKPDVGGNAGTDKAYCSWVSIKRINKQDTCQEVVCIFMGDGSNQLRSSFLHDLSNIDGAVHLFGQTPQPPNARLNRR